MDIRDWQHISQGRHNGRQVPPSAVAAGGRALYGNGAKPGSILERSLLPKQTHTVSCKPPQRLVRPHQVEQVGLASTPVLPDAGGIGGLSDEQVWAQAGYAGTC
jgi:hypothetical protein